MDIFFIPLSYRTYRMHKNGERAISEKGTAKKFWIFGHEKG